MHAQVVFNVSKDADAPPPQFPPGFDYDQLRSISYSFSSKFLKFKEVGTT
jgi:hypothetical protein